MSNAQRYRNRMAEAREQEQMRDEYHAMEERLSNLEDEYAKLWQMYGDLEDDRDRLREALKEAITEIGCLVHPEFMSDSKWKKHKLWIDSLKRIAGGRG